MTSDQSESSKKRKASADDTDKNDNTLTTTKSQDTTTKPTKKTIKKKKLNNNGKDSSKKCIADAEPSSSSSKDVLSSFKPFDLSEIKSNIKNLAQRVPEVPSEGLDPDNKENVKEWAMTMQAIIEEFNLLLTCVAAATYKWGSDRTGAADQNLSLLSSELGNSQEQISSSVGQRLTNVLAPVVEIVTKETVVKKVKDETTGEECERRINEFSREVNDPGFVHLCHVVLCRNAVMLRHIVLTNFHKVGKCIQDYLKATKKDGNQSRSDGFY